MNPLQLAIQFTLGAEGKFTIDNGGPTMYGVTQAVYDAYRDAHGLGRTTVAGIRMNEVLDIMQTEYWEPAHCDLMTPQLAIAHFDWSYNHGDTGALKTLQGVLGVGTDGIWGHDTQSAVQDAGDAIVPRYLDARRAWYRADAARDMEVAKDLKGWLNRVDALQSFLAEHFPA
jgi:lysozyme family protein